MNIRLLNTTLVNLRPANLILDNIRIVNNMLVNIRLVKVSLFNTRLVKTRMVIVRLVNLRLVNIRLVNVGLMIIIESLYKATLGVLAQELPIGAKARAFKYSCSLIHPLSLHKRFYPPINGRQQKSPPADVHRLCA